jgi:uncharacterized protein (TIGR03437 family)
MIRTSRLLLIAPLLLAQDPIRDQFTISPQRLDFTGFTQSDPPGSKSLVIVSPRAPATLTVIPDTGYDGSPAPTWLRVTPTDITTPTRIAVSVNTTGLAAGTYLARLRIRTRLTIALLDIAAIPVTLTLADVPANQFQLLPTPSLARFTVAPASLRAEQILVVRAAPSAALSCPALRAVSPEPWLTAQVEQGPPCRVRLTANGSGLRAGPYSAALRLSSLALSRSVPVSLFVGTSGPQLALNPAGFQFEARQGNGNSVTRNLSIRNTGDAPLNFTATVIDPAQSPWLTVSNTSGAVPPGGAFTLPITVNPASLDPGDYYALIQINDQVFSVNLAIRPVADPPVAAPSPSGLLFTADPGRPAASQNISIFTSSTTPVPFQVSASTADGGNWLTVSPASGTTATAAVAQVSVTASAAGLAPGAYAGEVNTVLLAGASVDVRTVNVTLIVRSAPPRTAGACPTTSLTATHTGLVSNFLTRAGWPTPLNVRLIDNCGDLIPNAQVVLSFSNGDPPLALVNLNNGNYAGTWTPAAPTPDTLSVRADAVLNNLATSLELIGSVAATPAPVLSSGGVLNNLFPNPGAPLSPGMIVQIFGGSLGASTVSTPLQDGRLPVDFGGLSVLIAGRRAPLYFVSPTQINAQIPFDLPVNSQAQLLVRSGRLISTPEPVSIASSQPGLLGFPDGRLVAQDQQFRLIDPANPARRGSVLTIYLTGLGITNPPVETGLVTPAVLARVRDTAAVEIDGRPAEVLFAGLTPMFIGLYQINFAVPSDARLADLSVRVIQNNTPSNTFTLPVR